MSISPQGQESECVSSPISSPADLFRIGIWPRWRQRRMVVVQEDDGVALRPRWRTTRGEAISAVVTPPTFAALAAIVLYAALGAARAPMIAGASVGILVFMGFVTWIGYLMLRASRADASKEPPALRLDRASRTLSIAAAHESRVPVERVRALVVVTFTTTVRHGLNRTFARTAALLVAVEQEALPKDDAPDAPDTDERGDGTRFLTPVVTESTPALRRAARAFADAAGIGFEDVRLGLFDAVRDREVTAWAGDPPDLLGGTALWDP